jgi:hypothetical protein
MVIGQSSTERSQEGKAADLNIPSVIPPEGIKNSRIELDPKSNNVLPRRFVSFSIDF